MNLDCFKTACDPEVYENLDANECIHFYLEDEGMYLFSGYIDSSCLDVCEDILIFRKACFDDGRSPIIPYDYIEAIGCGFPVVVGVGEIKDAVNIAKHSLYWDEVPDWFKEDFEKSKPVECFSFDKHYDDIIEMFFSTPGRYYYFYWR